MNDHQEDYYNAIRTVIASNPKKTIEIAEVKTGIIDTALGFKPPNHPKTYNVLSLGCSLVATGLAARGHTVRAIYCPKGQHDFLTSTFDDINGYKDTMEGMVDHTLQDEVDAGNTYDLVLGLDQTMTYFDTENEQREFIEQVAKVTKGKFITSLVDYKNQTSQSRMADLPLTININGKQNLFMNHRSWNPVDRQNYENNWLHIEEDKLIGSSKTKRRTMFFKQLAKFSSDAGSRGFTIHKNLFYKPLINKTFEHVISIDYE
jgi:hypothetical protein